MPLSKRCSLNLCAMVMGALFLGAGLTALVGAWGAYLTDTAILKSGPRAQGHLTGKNFLFDAGGDSDYILEYRFTTHNGEKVAASRGVGKTLWASLRKGDTFVVHYSAKNPKRNFPEGSGVTSPGMTLFASAFGILFAVFGGLLITGARKRSHGKA